VRLAELAADLGRVASSARHATGSEAVAALLEESQYFIEWAAAGAPVEVAEELGLPGLVAWLVLLLLVILASWRVYRQGQRVGDRWLVGLGAGLLCSQVALVIHGLTDAVTWGTRPAVVVWAVWGVAMATGNQLIAKQAVLECSGQRDPASKTSRGLTRMHADQKGNPCSSAER